MKKILFILCTAMVAFACGNQDSNSSASADSANKTTVPAHEEPAAKADVTENPDYVKGLELIAKSDCLTCHTVDEKKVGPPYRDVANKYASNEQTITLLADKVIKGGSGVWGPVPMTPHPALSKEDVTQMIKYILLLKNK